MDATIDRFGALRLQEDGRQNDAENAANSVNDGQEYTPQVSNSNTVFQNDADEMEKFRQECDHRLQQAQHENELMYKRLQEVEKQNALMRQALNSMDSYRKQVDDQNMHIEQLQQQVKQLRSNNVQLQYMLQQSDANTQDKFLPPRPPDIF